MNHSKCQVHISAVVQVGLRLLSRQHFACFALEKGKFIAVAERDGEKAKKNVSFRCMLRLEVRKQKN